MEQVTLIVWRESIEALLIIGILYRWIKSNGDNQCLRFLYYGIALGIALALVLAAIIYQANILLPDYARDLLQVVMVFVASGLIVQMVFFMNSHSGQFAKNLQQQAGTAAFNTNIRWNMLIIAMLAIAREGSETVIFLYGVGAAQKGTDLFGFIISSLIGLALAILTIWLLQKGRQFISMRQFFKITMIILLFLASGLVTSGVDMLSSMIMGLDLPEQIYSFVGSVVWNSTFLLDDSSRLGGMVAIMTGYRSNPSALTILIYILYWGVIYKLWHRAAKPQNL